MTNFGQCGLIIHESFAWRWLFQYAVLHAVRLLVINGIHILDYCKLNILKVSFSFYSSFYFFPEQIFWFSKRFFHNVIVKRNRFKKKEKQLKKSVPLEIHYRWCLRCSKFATLLLPSNVAVTCRSYRKITKLSSTGKMIDSFRSLRNYWKIFAFLLLL